MGKITRQKISKCIFAEFDRKNEDSKFSIVSIHNTCVLGIPSLTILKIKPEDEHDFADELKKLLEKYKF